MPNAVIEQPFFCQDVRRVARELLGKRLVSRLGAKRVAGIVVETEAYLAEDDSACHGSRGLKPGNRAMFGAAGRAYVYPIHAKHCFNVVTGPVGVPSAVLIRALQPTQGIAVIQKRRGTCRRQLLSTGPARLCQALGIDRQIDGLDLTRGRKVWFEDTEIDPVQADSIRITQRIGVTSARDLKLRYVIAGNPFVSGPRRMR